MEPIKPLSRSILNCEGSQQEENQSKIEIRQIKYLNNIVEQDHRFIKRIVKGMLGFKSFDSASITLNGIELEDDYKGAVKKGGKLPSKYIKNFLFLSCLIRKKWDHFTIIRFLRRNLNLFSL